MNEGEIAMVQAFYDARVGYFGAEACKVTPENIDAEDRATLEGIRAAIAMETRRAETTGSVAKR